MNNVVLKSFQILNEIHEETTVYSIEVIRVANY
jgi:hypothetical protein